ncbi:hypothetical protein D3C76_138880 [compost metagenome]
MVKHIQAYFESEDQAEGARTDLIVFGAKSIEVSSLNLGMGVGMDQGMEDSLNDSHNVLVPLLPVTGASSNMGGPYGAVGIPGTMNAQTVIPAITLGDRSAKDDGYEVLDEKGMAQGGYNVSDPIVDIDLVDRASSDHLKYVVTARVSDSQYEEVVSKLKSQGAIVDESLR